MRLYILLLIGLAGICAMPAGDARAGFKLEAIAARGQLSCVVEVGPPGFALSGLDGRWSGFDIDLCRAMAALVTGDADAISVVPAGSEGSEAILARGEADFAPRIAMPDVASMVEQRLVTGPPVWFEAHGLMMHSSLAGGDALMLEGAVVCLSGDAAIRRAFKTFAASRPISASPVMHDSDRAAAASFFAGGCDVLAAPRSALPGLRAAHAGDWADYPVTDDYFAPRVHVSAVASGDSDLAALLYLLRDALVRGDAARAQVAATLEAAALPPENADAFFALGDYAAILARHFGPETGLMAIPPGPNRAHAAGGLFMLK